MVRKSKKRWFIGTVVLVLTGFLIWRFIRPMNIFIVTEAFERPIDTTQAPAMFTTLRAEQCGVCHRELYNEWKTTIHSQAWTDPYFQVDWRFDNKQQICKNCHIPLDRQQEHLVLGFNDRDKWDPILAPNPDFDPQLQHEGVTCAVCHLRDGKILGPYDAGTAPHPVQKLDNANRICIRCHVVSGKRWDTFFRFPPCGTVAEIQTTRGGSKEFVQDSHEMNIEDIAKLNCVNCHMPLVERALVAGGKIRPVRRHLWRGGHNPAMVKSGLKVVFEETTVPRTDKRRFSVTLTNVGAAHYFPTGTPDRHLSVVLQAFGTNGRVIKEEQYILKRTVMWRPFIIDLWDTRLPYGKPRVYHFELAADTPLSAVQVQVHYHLLDENRRKRIGYQNVEPIHYQVFRQRLPLATRISHQR